MYFFSSGNNNIILFTLIYGLAGKTRAILFTPKNVRSGKNGNVRLPNVRLCRHILSVKVVFENVQFSEIECGNLHHKKLRLKMYRLRKTCLQRKNKRV